MIRLRALAFTVLFYGWTTIAGLVSIPLLPAPPRVLTAYSRFWIRVSLAILRATVGLRHEVRGLENLPDGPAIFALKHQSAWDTLAVNLVVRDGAIVLKRELTWIPLFGWCLLRSRQLPVDRGGGAAALRALVGRARERLAEGRPVVIYPEGTRTAPGERRTFHPGVAALYGALDVPVVPVALNSGLFWPRRSAALMPGTITVSILPPIPPGLNRRAFVSRLQDAIEAESAALAAEAVRSYPWVADRLPVDSFVEDVTAPRPGADGVTGA